MHEVSKFWSQRHYISEDSPSQGDAEHHESGLGRDFAMPQPPHSYKRCPNGEAGVQPESLDNVAMQQGKHHALGTAEGAVKSRKPMEGAGQHIYEFTDLLIYRFTDFPLQNYTLFTKWPKRNPKMFQKSAD